MSLANPEIKPRVKSSRGPAALVDRLLREQAELTAVERFAQRHEAAETPLRAKYYHELIPLSRPGPNEQYAFRVDLDSCSGCKACVAACHELNGLDEEETWRDVGLLVGTDADFPILQHVTTACHHCLEPGCLAGCPVRAYDKDPATGIVRHLDDQCIGCQYCVWTCPYEVPKFNSAKGIVRKCDMCQQRLAVDEAPACVQSCPSQAIAIDLVRIDDTRHRAARGEFLAVSPDPRHTQPTTRYVTCRPELASAQPADFTHDTPQPAHWPLLVMLVLTQGAVGILLAERFLSTGLALTDDGQAWRFSQSVMASTALILTALGLAIANLHLGRPALAFRAVLGWRTSWLSREVLAFGGFLLLAGLNVALTWTAPAFEIPPWGVELCRWLAAAAGIVAATTSGMVYVATQREVWSARRVFRQFSGSILLMGLTSGLVAINLARIHSLEIRHNPFAAFIACLFLDAITVLSSTRLFNARKEIRRFGFLNHAASNRTIDARVVALLMGPLTPVMKARSALGLAAGVVFVVMVASHSSLAAFYLSSPVVFLQTSLVAIVAIVRLASEIVERYVFFATAVTRKMPGGMP